MYLRDKIKSDCVGCKACLEICPNHCIKMVEDEEGFQYPSIDLSSCVKCNLCVKVCPSEFNIYNPTNRNKCYVGINKSSDVVYKSSSGGAFTAIYKELIKNSYIVCGVKYINHLKVVHDFAKTNEECEQFCKSKYIMSDTNGCFNKINHFLQSNKKVLFVGTPCQCAALQNFLYLKQTSKANLIEVDIICHGAPNQKIFDSYIKELEACIGSKVISYSFKSKTPVEGIINSRSAEIIFENGVTKNVDCKSDAYLNGYYNRLFNRPSCGECIFARPERVSDITIGDAWHIENLIPELDSLSGVSLIIPNSLKGEDILSKLKKSMKLYEVGFDWALKHNSQLNKPTEMHKNRKLFFKNWHITGFHKAVDESMKVNILFKIAKFFKWYFISKSIKREEK